MNFELNLHPYFFVQKKKKKIYSLKISRIEWLNDSSTEKKKKKKFSIYRERELIMVSKIVYPSPLFYTKYQSWKLEWNVPIEKKKLLTFK